MFPAIWEENQCFVFSTSSKWGTPNGPKVDDMGTTNALYTIRIQRVFFSGNKPLPFSIHWTEMFFSGNFIFRPVRNAFQRVWWLCHIHVTSPIRISEWWLLNIIIVITTTNIILEVFILNSLDTNNTHMPHCWTLDRRIKVVIL